MFKRSKIGFWLISAVGLGVAIVIRLLPHATSQSAIVTLAPSRLQQNSSLEDKAIPHYKHLFVIIAENKSYDQIIGNTDAPKLTQLAKTYGLATQFYGEVHPSEGNYVSMLGGSNFGIHDDDAFYCHAGSVEPFCGNSWKPGYVNHTIAEISLIDQLQKHDLTWKGYFEDIPEAGSKAIVSPSAVRSLYASKHNGFMSFKTVQDDPDRAKKIVNISQLSADLKSNEAPNYSHIILNECNEMHGLAECPNDHKIIQRGDTKIAEVVDLIIKSPLWAEKENNAIVITWDEGNGTTKGEQGCCGYDPKSVAEFGGGHIATIVITNHGPRGMSDSTPYNHNSLLRTTEDIFGIDEYLNQAGNLDQGIKPMVALFEQKINS
jgi:phospholipase C